VDVGQGHKIGFERGVVGLFEAWERERTGNKLAGCWVRGFGRLVRVQRTAVVLGRTELVSGQIVRECSGWLAGAKENACKYLLDGGVPSKLRERCSGSYLVFGSEGFTKSVSSRSWISRATGESVDALRRHCSPETRDRAVFWVRSRLRSEAVTSCNAIAMVMLCGGAIAVFRCRRPLLRCSTRLHFVKDVGLRGFPIRKPCNKIGSNSANHKTGLEWKV
jgi:hypothetical protein